MQIELAFFHFTLHLMRKKGNHAIKESITVKSDPFIGS